ncbi:hypothetical protein SMAC4_13442 [Sordaria macrospora]|uniref:uncharacterized protein n=1 Tax=Sordaria macrospora TaxID=5147 RepID=UPI002B2A092C|nr:hypothetical protein SMAC4_13442 [Sordaria macrospora]
MSIEEYDQYEQYERDHYERASESDDEDYIRGSDINKENELPRGQTPVRRSHSVPPTPRIPLADIDERDEWPLATIIHDEPKVHTDLSDAMRDSDTDTDDQVNRNEQLQSELDRLNQLVDIEQAKITKLKIRQLEYNRHHQQIHRKDCQSYEDTFGEAHRTPEELIAFTQASFQGLKKKCRQETRRKRTFDLDDKYDRQLDTEYYAGPIDEEGSFIEIYPPKPKLQSIGVSAFEADVHIICDQPWTSQAGDHPQVHPEHPSHKKVAWIHCLYNACPWHLSYKMEHDHFPQRIMENGDFAPVRATYHKDSINMWDVGRSRDREGGGKLLKLPLKDGYGRDCMSSPYSCYQECCRINCAVHMADKARQWHAGQALREKKNKQGLRKEQDKETAAASSSGTSMVCGSPSRSQRKRHGGRRRQGNGASSSREDRE